MENLANGTGIPIGLGMALAKNVKAMNYFSSLSNEGRSQIISHTHNIHSKREMQAYVDSLVE